MLITEILKADTGAKFKITDSGKLWKATTKTKSGDLLAIKAKYVESDDAWYVVFTLNGDTEATDNNKPFEVMPQVMEAPRLFEREKKPKHIQIESVENNRTRIYLKLVKRTLPGWHIYHLDDHQLSRIDIMKSPAKAILTDNGGVINFIKRPGFVVKTKKNKAKEEVKIVEMNNVLSMRDWYVPDFPELFYGLLKDVMGKFNAKVSPRETTLIKYGKKHGYLTDDDVAQ